MRKILFITFFALIASFQVEAQGLRFGVQTSPTVTWLTTTNNQIVGDGTNLGINIGLDIDYFFAENYAISSGISLALNQGGGLLYSFGGNFWPRTAASNANIPNATVLNPIAENSTLGFHLQYIEIPIGLKLRSSEVGYFRYYANLPVLTLNFLTKGTGDITLNGGEEFTTGEIITSDVNGFGVTWGFGGGAEYDLTQNMKIVGGIYYQSSLLDLTKNANTVVGATGVEENSKANLNRITIKLGLAF